MRPGPWLRLSVSKVESERRHRAAHAIEAGLPMFCELVKRNILFVSVIYHCAEPYDQEVLLQDIIGFCGLPDLLPNITTK